jgi:hypothetical protein
VPSAAYQELTVINYDGVSFCLSLCLFIKHYLVLLLNLCSRSAYAQVCATTSQPTACDEGGYGSLNEKLDHGNFLSVMTASNTDSFSVMTSYAHADAGVPDHPEPSSQGWAIAKVCTHSE